MSQASVVNCDVCQCRVELDPSLGVPNTNEKFSGDCLSDLAERLRDSLDTTQSGSNLLDIFCNSSDPLQFPLCKKCFNSLSKDLNKQLSDLEAECVVYKQELARLEKVGTSPNNVAAKRRLESLEREEKELMEELKRVDAEEQALQKELDAKVRERNATKDQDSDLYRKLRDNHWRLMEQAEDNRGLRTRQKYLNDQLKLLSKTQVLDMIFYIWMDGDYGTINGMRLGRLRHEMVDWNEINAAFGHIAFLLQVLADRINFTFDGYDIYPCGSHSLIQTTRGADLTLYGNGGWRPFGQTQLDQAIMAYMECFCQLETKLRTYFQQGSQILPYRMTKDVIIDSNSPYSVKMQLNSEERWTKAMKCLLANLKRAIAIIVNLNVSANSATAGAIISPLKDFDNNNPSH